MARIPVAGTVDFKWLLIGIAFALFGLPFIMQLLGKGRRSGTRPAA
jgi:hypothetical protein